MLKVQCSTKAEPNEEAKWCFEHYMVFVQQGTVEQTYIIDAYDHPSQADAVKHALDLFSQEIQEG